MGSYIVLRSVKIDGKNYGRGTVLEGDLAAEVDKNWMLRARCAPNQESVSPKLTDKAATAVPVPAPAEAK